MRSSPTRLTAALAATVLLFTVPAAGAAQAPRIFIDDASVTEGNGGVGQVAFTVRVVRDTTVAAQSITVNYQGSGVTAQVGTSQCGNNGDDVILQPSALTISASQTSGSVLVTVCSDVTDEADSETFTVTLTGGNGSTIVDGQATGTLLDDDTPPRLSVSDFTGNEGNTGSNGAAAFTITLSAASGRQVSVIASTQNGTATGAALCAGTADFVSQNVSVVFAVGQISRPVPVPYCGDFTFEPNETFSLVLSSATNATVLDGTGSGRLNNDDPQPTIAFAQPLTRTYPEGSNAATSGDLLLTISVAPPSGASVTVGTGGTAVVGTACVGAVDVAFPGSLTVTWGPNDAAQKTVNYQICGDARDDEDAEVLTVTLTGASGGAAVSNTASAATYTITDDDPTPTISLADASVTEPGTGGPLNSGTAKVSVGLTLSSPSNRSVSYTLAAGQTKQSVGGIGSATSGVNCSGLTDFLAFSHAMSLAPGATSAAFTVTVCGDSRSEGTGSPGSATRGKELFQVSASNPANATLAKGTALVLILDP